MGPEFPLMLVLSRKPLQECRADLVVCGVEATGKLDAGVGAAISREAGPELGEALRAALAAMSREPGSAVLTPAFGLADRGVRLLALVVTRPVPTLEELRRSLQSVVHQARELKIASLACPALGCGAGALPAMQVAYVLLEVLGPAGIEVELALPGDREYQAFVEVKRRLKA